MSFDPKKMMAQVAKMQEDLAKAQEDLANQTVEGSAGGGMVTVTANGQGEIVSVKLAREAVDPDDVEMLEDLILAAVKEATRSAQALAQQKMSGLTGGLGGLGLPGL
jgi:DNA-binding YbaB/EbfC family protein